MNGQSGSATILMMFAVSLVSVVGVGATAVGLLLTAQVRAVTAAEAGALAAAVATYPGASRQTPVVAATRAVSDNQSDLERCICDVDSTLRPRIVTVVAMVEVDVPLFGVLEVRGSARAEFDPAAWLGV